MKPSRLFCFFAVVAGLLLASCQTANKTPPPAPAQPKAKPETPPAVEAPTAKAEPPPPAVVPAAPAPVVSLPPAPPAPPPTPLPLTSPYTVPPRPPGKLNRLQIDVFAIGEADAMLVIGPPPLRRTLLIDCGEPTFTSKKYADVARQIVALTGGRHLDYFLASSFNLEHLGGAQTGLAGLMASGFDLGTAIDLGNLGAKYMRSRPKPRAVYLAYEANMKTWQLFGQVKQRQRPKFGVGQIDLGPGVKVKIVAFAGKFSDADPGALALLEQQEPGVYDKFPASENDLSVALEIRTGEFELFTGGDMPGNANSKVLYERSDSDETYTNVEKHLVDHWVDLNESHDVEVYRVNDHGSEYATSATLLNALDPEVMIYSTGGWHDHPSHRVARLGALTAQQYLTSKLDGHEWPDETEFDSLHGKVVGNVEIRVAPDGRTYSVNGLIYPTFTDLEEQQRSERAVVAIGPDGEDVGTVPREVPQN